MASAAEQSGGIRRAPQPGVQPGVKGQEGQSESARGAARRGASPAARNAEAGRIGAPFGPWVYLTLDPEDLCPAVASVQNTVQYKRTQLPGSPDSVSLPSRQAHAAIAAAATRAVRS